MKRRPIEIWGRKRGWELKMMKTKREINQKEQKWDRAESNLWPDERTSTDWNIYKSKTPVTDCQRDQKKKEKKKRKEKGVVHVAMETTCTHVYSQNRWIKCNGWQMLCPVLTVVSTHPTQFTRKRPLAQISTVFSHLSSTSMMCHILPWSWCPISESFPPPYHSGLAHWAAFITNTQYTSRRKLLQRMLYGGKNATDEWKSRKSILILSLRQMLSHKFETFIKDLLW